jgi:hypothetical protein
MDEEEWTAHSNGIGFTDHSHLFTDHKFFFLLSKKGKTKKEKEEKKMQVVYFGKKTTLPNIKYQPPPFVAFTLDGDRVIDRTVIGVDKFRYSEGKLKGVPWKVVFKWASQATPDHGKKFLAQLTLGNKNGLKVKLKTEKKTNRPPFHDLPAISTCSCPMHRAYCGTSPIVPSHLMDEASYLAGQLICSRCKLNTTEWSRDGYLNLASAKPLLLHMVRDPDYNDLLDTLLALENVTIDQVNGYKYTSPMVEPATFSSLTVAHLFDGTYDIVRVFNNPKACVDFLLKPAEMERILHAAINYRLFGRASMIKLKGKSKKMLDLAPYMPVVQEPTGKEFDYVVVSVFSRNISKLFRDNLFNASAYIHVFGQWGGGFIDQPGVVSLPLAEFLLLPPSGATVVAWPSQFLSMAELHDLAGCVNRVILAGTPFVIGDGPCRGQFFTSQIQKGKECTYLESFQATNPIARLFETFPAEPLSSTHPLLCETTHTRIQCPVYLEDEKLYYNRFLLTTLIYYSPNPFRLSIVAGPLVASSLSGTALCSRHVVSQTESTL